MFAAALWPDGRIVSCLETLRTLEKWKEPGHPWPEGWPIVLCSTPGPVFYPGMGDALREVAEQVVEENGLRDVLPENLGDDA